MTGEAKTVDIKSLPSAVTGRTPPVEGGGGGFQKNSVTSSRVSAHELHKLPAFNSGRMAPCAVPSTAAPCSAKPMMVTLRCDGRKAPGGRVLTPSTTPTLLLQAPLLCPCRRMLPAGGARNTAACVPDRQRKAACVFADLAGPDQQNRRGDIGKPQDRAGTRHPERVPDARRDQPLGGHSVVRALGGGESDGALDVHGFPPNGAAGLGVPSDIASTIVCTLCSNIFR